MIHTQRRTDTYHPAALFLWVKWYSPEDCFFFLLLLLFQKRSLIKNEPSSQFDRFGLFDGIDGCQGPHFDIGNVKGFLRGMVEVLVVMVGDQDQTGTGKGMAGMGVTRGQVGRQDESGTKLGEGCVLVAG